MIRKFYSPGAYAEANAVKSPTALEDIHSQFCEQTDRLQKNISRINEIGNRLSDDSANLKEGLEAKMEEKFRAGALQNLDHDLKKLTSLNRELEVQISKLDNLI